MDLTGSALVIKDRLLMIDNIHFLWEPVRCCVIKMPLYRFQQCEDFAHEVYESNKDLYEKRGQSYKPEVIRQIITGKLGEWAVYYYLTTFLGSHTTEPDMEIYGANRKSYDADLCCGNPKEPMIRHFLHVKSILCTSAKRYGLSWLMEKKDPLFSKKTPELMAYCQVIDRQIVHFYGFQPSDTLTIGEPRKTSLESKCGLYFKEQDPKNINFMLK